MSGAENERRRLVSALPQARSLANAECLTGTFQASHDGQLQLEQAKDACYLLSGDEAEPDADVDVDEQGDQPIDDDQDGEPEVKRKKKKTKGRVKISMEFIEHKSRRYTTFSKRKTGLMKKAYELATLTGAQVMLLVASETGHVYTFATRKLQSMITSESGKALIQTCLNSPDSPSPATAVQPTSPAPTPAPSTASANCTAGPLPPTGVFQSSANHTGSAYLHASQSQVPMQVQAGNNVAFTPQNAAAFIAKFDDAQFGYEFQPAFAPDDLEANDDSDSQSEAVTAATASRGTTATSRTADSSRYRKIAPSAAGQSLSQSQSKQQQPQQPSRNVVQPNANRSALRLSKPAATHSREVASTSASSGSLQTKFVAVPTFHVTNYNNSPQLDSDG